MTNFNLKPGLTLVVGTVGTGKTSMLLCIGEELQAEGVEVKFLSTEGLPALIEHFQPKFHIGMVEDIDGLKGVIRQTLHGDAVLCDEIGILNDHPPGDAQQVGGRTRRLTHMCRKLHYEAEQRHIYLVVSLQAGRPMGKDVQIANELKHRYPILEIQGSGSKLTWLVPMQLNRHLDWPITIHERAS